MGAAEFRSTQCNALFRGSVDFKAIDYSTCVGVVNHEFGGYGSLIVAPYGDGTLIAVARGGVGHYGERFHFSVSCGEILHDRGAQIAVVAGGNADYTLLCEACQCARERIRTVRGTGEESERQVDDCRHVFFGGIFKYVLYASGDVAVIKTSATGNDSTARSHAVERQRFVVDESYASVPREFGHHAYAIV